MASATYEQAIHRANVWLSDVTEALGSQDRHYGLRVLRTWLHTLRDRLTVDTAVKFGQQLPELLRGTYYDGWEPRRAPMKFNAADYVQRFAAESFVPDPQVPGIASTVTRVISEHMSPGQVDETLAELPTSLRETVRDGAPPTQTGQRNRQYGASRYGADRYSADRYGADRYGADRYTSDRSLEDRISTLTEAVLALARGLEGGRPAGQRIDSAQAARSARLAEEIILAGQ